MYLAFGAPLLWPHPMTDKRAVIDAPARLPEAASFEEITEELHIMAAIRRARSGTSAGRSKSHQDVEQLVEFWATSWNSNYGGRIRPLRISGSSTRISLSTSTIRRLRSDWGDVSWITCRS